MEILGGTGRYFSRQNSWRDGTVFFFFRGGTGRLLFFSEAGRGGRFFFPKRDGAVVFFSEAGQGGCIFFPRRDGAVVFFFRGGTGRGGCVFSAPGPGGCIFCSRRDERFFLSAGTRRLYFLFAPGRAFFF